MSILSRLSTLIKSAQKELPLERLKILLLATMAGLRRNEIDKLEWRAFQWRRKHELWRLTLRAVQQIESSFVGSALRKHRPEMDKLGIEFRQVASLQSGEGYDHLPQVIHALV